MAKSIYVAWFPRFCLSCKSSCVSVRIPDFPRVIEHSIHFTGAASEALTAGNLATTVTQRDAPYCVGMGTEISSIVSSDVSLPPRLFLVPSEFLMFSYQRHTGWSPFLLHVISPSHTIFKSAKWMTHELIFLLMCVTVFVCVPFPVW